MRGKELVKSYQWVIDGVKPFCDEAVGDLTDYDHSYAVCAAVGYGDQRKRFGLRCQYFFRDDEEPAFYSLNADIEAGKLTREEAIDEFKQRIQAGV